MGHPVVVEFFAVSGNMANLYLRDGEAWTGFEKLNIYGTKLDILPNGPRIVDLLAFDEETMPRAEEFGDFLLDPKTTEVRAIETTIENFARFRGESINEAQIWQDDHRHDCSKA